MKVDQHEQMLGRLKRQVVWLLVVVGLTVILPGGLFAWFHLHREARMSRLQEWHVMNQGASHDAVLALDELLLEGGLSVDASAPVGVPYWSARQTSIYNRFTDHLSDLISLGPIHGVKGREMIMGRIRKVSDEIRSPEALSAAPMHSTNTVALLRMMRDSLEQLRMLHRAEFDGQNQVLKLQHETELAVFVPTLAVLIVFGTVLSAAIFGTIRRQFNRENLLLSALAESESSYRNLVDQLPHGVIETDLEGRIVVCNPAYNRIYGAADARPQVEFVWSIAGAEESREKLRRHFLAMREGKSTVNSIVLNDCTTEGRSVTTRMDWEPRRKQGGAITGYLCVVTDITSEELVRQYLHEERNFSNAVLDNAGVVGVVLDCEGRIQRFNRAAERVSGRSASEVMGRTPWETVLPPEDAQAFREEAFEKHIDDPAFRIGTFRNHWLAQNGERPLLEWTNTVLRDAEGRPEHMVAIGIDITDRTRMDALLRESLAEKDTLLREIHHRVKNNLQIVSSVLRFHARSAQGPEAKEIFAECQARLESMSLVHSLLYRSNELSRIDFDRHVRELVARLNTLIGKNRVEIAVDTSKVQLPIAIAQPVGMILCELITNVLKHAFPNGQNGKAAVRLEAVGDQVSLIVHDDGIGMPPDFAPEAGDSFGWRLIRSLVKQVGGRIAISDEGGSTITVTFPKDQIIPKAVSANI